MIYSGDSNGQDIVSFADDIAGTNSITFPIASKTRYANKTMRTIWSWIFEAYGGWQFDDANNTDLPAARTGLNANQTDYDVPATALTVRSVEYKPQGSTLFQQLVCLSEEDLKQAGQSEQAAQYTSSVPYGYHVVGTSIKLIPPASYTQTDSLRVSFDRGTTDFSVSDTTKTPGFVSQFHDAVPTGMAMEWAKNNAGEAYPGLKDEFYGDYKGRIQDYYRARYQEKYPAEVNVFDFTRIMM